MIISFRKLAAATAATALLLSGNAVANAQSSDLFGSATSSLGGSNSLAPQTLEQRLQSAAERHIRSVGHTVAPSAREVAQRYADMAARGELQFVANQYFILGEGGFGSVTRIPIDAAEGVIDYLNSPTSPALIKVRGGAAVTVSDGVLYLAEYYHG